MSQQNIELPQTVEQLQFLALQLREELIEEKVAREHEVNELKDELAITKDHHYHQLLAIEINQKETEDLQFSRKLSRRDDSNPSIHSDNSTSRVWYSMIYKHNTLAWIYSSMSYIYLFIRRKYKRHNISCVHDKTQQIYGIRAHKI